MTAILSQMIAAALDGPDDLAEECMNYLRAVAAAPKLPPPAQNPSNDTSPMHALRELLHQEALLPMQPPVLLAPESYQPNDREREVAALVATIVERHQSRPSIEGGQPIQSSIRWIMVGERSHPSDAYRTIDGGERLAPGSVQQVGASQGHRVLDLASIRLLAKSIVRTHRPRANLLLHEHHGLVIRIKGPIDPKSTIDSWSPHARVGELLTIQNPTDPLVQSAPSDLHVRVDESETWSTATVFDHGACLLVQSTGGRPWVLERRERPYIMLRAFWIRDVLGRLQHGPVELASSWYVMVRSPLMVCSVVNQVRSIPSSLRRNLVQWSGIWADQSSFARPQLISQCMETRDPAELNEYFVTPQQFAA